MSNKKKYKTEREIISSISADNIANLCSILYTGNIIVHTKFVRVHIHTYIHTISMLLW